MLPDGLDVNGGALVAGFTEAPGPGVPASGLALGMRTTAEGVENEAQLARVRAAGCTEVQGCFFGRPMPHSMVAGYLALRAADGTAAASSAT